MPQETPLEKQVEQYKVTVQNPVVVKPLEQAQPAEPGTFQPQAPAERKTAILICHGMGQQVQFSTLNSVVNALFRAQGSRQGGVDVQMIRAGDGQLPRAKVFLRDPQNNMREVHLYEAYWAVLTEGQISGTDVVKFLIGAGWEGIRGALKPFERWMFGDWQRLPRARALTHLLVAVAVVCSIAIYGYAAAAAKALSLFGLVNSGLPLLGALISHVFAFMLAFLWVLLMIAALTLVYQIADRLSNKVAQKEPPLLLRIINYVTGALLLFAAVPIGLSLLYHISSLLAYGPTWFERNSYVLTVALHNQFQQLPGGHRIVYLSLWALAAVAVYAGRWFLVEYVGDVAIYVTAYKVNRFYEVCQQIKDVGQRVASAVFKYQPT